MRPDLLRLGAVAILSIAIAAPVAAQNVSVLNAPPAERTTTAVTTEPNPIRIAVPVALSADLGGEGQKGVAPTIGFQIFQRNTYFLGAFFTPAATDSTVKEDYGGFVLNPPPEGRSFHVAGNYAWKLPGKTKDKEGKEQVREPVVLLGLVVGGVPPAQH